MLCERCKEQEAAFCISEVIDGEEKRHYLCTHCMDKEKSELNIESLLFNNFLSELMKIALKEGHVKPSQKESPKTCPKCHLSLEEFLKIGKFGCEMCYTTFDAEVKKALINVHGNTKHTGKTLVRENQKENPLEKITSLKKELKAAIKEEAYEEAARLRDEIRTLREGGDDSCGTKETH